MNKKLRAARSKGIFIDEQNLSLIFFEVTDEALFSVLAPYAKKVLKRTDFEAETQISALDFLERIGCEYCSEEDFLPTIYHPSSYLVGSIALGTLMSLFPDTMGANRINRKSLSKYLRTELLVYEFLFGKLSEDSFIRKLKRSSSETLSLTCWRISRIMNGLKKGQRVLKNNSFFLSDVWGSLIARHGKRGIFYGNSEIGDM